MTYLRFISVIAMVVLAGCATPPPCNTSTMLKNAFKNDFLVGTALNDSQIQGNDPKAVAIVQQQFNAISPENCLKWESVHPQPGKYDFSAADQYVAFGKTNHMFIVGHNLVWHQQTPDWVFQDTNGNMISRDALIARMRDHIDTIVGRYKGRIGGWDVVNEALNEDGTMRTDKWDRIIGDDYVVLAYQFAHQADPNMQLYYNDYSLENKPKREGAIALIKKLQAAGVPIYAVGLQGHYKMDWPTTGQLDKTIKQFAALGVKVNITELDVDLLPQPSTSQGAEVSMNYKYQAKMNPYTNGLPASVQHALANRYKKLFKVFVADHQDMQRVTLWGVTDSQSWLNYWPISGRSSYPLLFGRDYQPKPAFEAVLSTAN